MIGFLGKKHMGKDTAADYYVNQGYTKRAFAYPLKRGVQEWFGFTDEQLFTDKKEDIDKNWGISPRRVYQTIGTEVVRDLFPSLLFPDIGNNFWIRSADIWCKKNKDEHNGLVVWSDVRYQNEVDYILNNGGKVYKIVRSEVEKECIDGHKSEKSIDEIKNYTCVIRNDGSVDDLYDKLKLLGNNKLIKK